MKKLVVLLFVFTVVFSCQKKVEKTEEITAEPTNTNIYFAKDIDISGKDITVGTNVIEIDGGGKSLINEKTNISFIYSISKDI